MNRSYRLSVNYRSAEYFPEVSEEHDNRAYERAEYPGYPEEPTPFRAERSEDSDNKKSKQVWQRAHIGVVARLSQLGSTMREVEDESECERGGEDDEQPASELTSTREM